MSRQLATLPGWDDDGPITPHGETLLGVIDYGREWCVAYLLDETGGPKFLVEEWRLAGSRWWLERVYETKLRPHVIEKIETTPGYLAHVVDCVSRPRPASRAA